MLPAPIHHFSPLPTLLLTRKKKRKDLCSEHIMAAKPPVSMALFLSLNLLCFALVISKFLPNCIPDPPRGGGCGHPRPPKPPRSGPTSGHKPGKCPRDALKLGVCANLLNDLVHLVIGASPSKTPCCALIQGLADLEAAVCLCTAIRLNLLGINLNVPLSLSLLLNFCGSKVPRGFQCP